MVQIKAWIDVDRSRRGVLPEVAMLLRTVGCSWDRAVGWICECVLHECIIPTLRVPFVEPCHRGLIQIEDVRELVDIVDGWCLGHNIAMVDRGIVDL